MNLNPDINEGVIVQCVRCKAKQTIPFEEAAMMSDIPVCDRCLMPMVAIGAFRKPPKRQRRR